MRYESWAAAPQQVALGITGDAYSEALPVGAIIFETSDLRVPIDTLEFRPP